MANLTEPVITAVAVSPNPANINQSITVSVNITEVEIVIYNRYPVSGTFAAGQSVNIKSKTEVA